MSIEIKLNRLDKTYKPGEKVSGVVVANMDSSCKHSGIALMVDGLVNLQLSARSVGIFEALYSTVKPQPLVHMEIKVAEAGKLNSGTTEIPFEFVLKPVPGQQLYDTYHGVYVNVRYNLSIEMPRGMFSSPLKTVREFYVQLEREADVAKSLAAAKPFPFKITPDSLQNVKEASKKKIPEFLFEGHLNSTLCPLNQPFSGIISIKKCPVNVKSIEVQLARIESCIYPEGQTRECTEIQNIQVVDGNVARNLEIPLHMVFPRLFTCCTTITKLFKIEYQVNLIITFADNHMVTETIPIILCR